MLRLKHELDARSEEITVATCDPLLILLVSSMMKHQRLSSQRLEKFAHEAAAAFQTDASANEECSDLFCARYLLAKLGLIKLPKRSTLIQRSADFWVTCNEPFMRSVAAEVTASTVFGTQNRCNSEAIDTLRVAFSGWTLSALYEYNLELGAFLARTLNYLTSKDSRTLKEICQFLLFQQQPDGRFGYLANRANNLQLTKPGFNEDYELYLPVTVSCLWTILELQDKKIRVFALEA